MALTTSLDDLSVLLVEPSSMQANLVSRMLENQGVRQVSVVGNAQAALESLHKGHADRVVISSLYLPDILGTDLVTAMRRDPLLESVPFILVSSETRPQVLDPICQSGACIIVPKPFTEQQLSLALYAAADYLNPPEDLDLAEMEELRVLMVDDSLASRKHMRRLLSELGIERIIEAEDGRQAVALLQENTVDLVITDYNMPEMDGRELTEHIRTQSWQNTVPILMVTSEQNAGRLAAVERAGVSAMCDKPFEAGGIRRLISGALSRS
ncbi:response regulator [Rhodocyclus tenuis]|uniref:Two-component system chemotaxis response regulator CheY n=1 Tax=Rhodocyclus tenuis TaxID=1066 RepID=A0A840G4M4_RHOTE|nr:response regulator [Rhodocyclus tenuis]MBB4245960.1 two-component system chemotaxis response regulator CheY [Rhodocyclus tenuis]